MEDGELVRRVLARDPAGLEALLARYGGLLDYVARGILPAGEAEECAAEVRLKLWEGLGGYDPEKGSLRAWLTALCRNAAVSRLRALSRRSGREGELPDELPDRAEGPEEAVLRRERALLVRKAVQQLSGRERDLFYRKYYYLQSTARMAAELGMSERAVEGRLYRLRERLRKELGGEAP